MRNLEMWFSISSSFKRLFKHCIALPLPLHLGRIASVMAASSPPKPSISTINLHSNSPNNPSAFSTNRPTLKFRTRSAFQSTTLRTKWGNQSGSRTGSAVVRCTAEGMERSIPFGRRAIGSAADEQASGIGVGLPERFKVVALTAFVMCLCNADRVVMSVAIVPLAAKYGWSSSFLGVVQVRKTKTLLLFNQ